MGNLDECIIEKIWSKGKIKDGFNSGKYRFGVCDALMQRDKYDDRNDNFG
ncbi:MAG: hypothetical protein LBK53_01520 [Heliobacteriaceae bacterium]|jgi:hypothetical protein|nr:hypothetical protein [Heliobacteriaceae bacterium]